MSTDRTPFILAVAVTTAWIVMVGAYMGNIGWGGVALTPAELVVVLGGAGDPSAPPKPAPFGPGARTKIGEPVFDHDDAEAMRRLADVLDRVDAPAPRSATPA